MLGEAMEKDLQVAESPEEQCSYLIGNVPCKYKRSDGSIYCPKHTRKKKSFSYQAEKWAPRITEISSGKLKDLTQEIGLCRMILERYLNQCQTDVELMQYNAVISSMVDRVDKLINSSMRVEKHLDQYFTMDQLLAFVEDILLIVSRFVDHDTMSQIAEGIRSLEIFDEMDQE